MNLPAKEAMAKDSYLDKEHQEALQINVRDSKGMLPKMPRYRSVSKEYPFSLMLVVLNMVKPNQLPDR